MKKIIFDLDNTLLMYDDKFLDDYNIVINKYKYNIKPVDLYKAIGKYEDLRVKYNISDMVDLINKQLNINMSVNTFMELLEVISNWKYNLSPGIVDVLNYLYSKYELYVLTNWFSACYEKRLDKAGILNYFKEVVGADKVAPKPMSDGYMYIAGNTKLDECLMIGDRIDIDIKGANNIGMPSILYDYKNEYNGVKKITKMKKLKEML